MQRQFKEYTIWNAVTPQTVTSSSDASPAVVTKVAHGLSTGNRIIINGHATNTTVNGIWEIVVLSSSTFTLKNINTGVAINGAGGGAGSGGVMVTAPAIALVEDYRDAILSIVTSGSFNATVKPAGSIGKLSEDADTHGDTPNFGATQSKSNPYTFIQLINLDTAAAVNGATGITSAGTDINNTYEVNVNGLKYFTLVPTAWTAGTITAKLQLLTNG